MSNLAYPILKSALREVDAYSARMEDVLRKSDLGWTAVWPVNLFRETGRGRRLPVAGIGPAAPGEEILVIEGTLIAESLRIGTNLENLKLTVRTISRFHAQDTTSDQPGIWTILDFAPNEAEAENLAQAFVGPLDQPGWYVDFRSHAETFVVFPGRIFRYPRGDDAGRADAQAHGRRLAIPDQQLDWPV